jgi:hypothetical protein
MAAVRARAPSAHAAHAADKPADRQRNRDGGVGPVLDGVAQRFFQRRGVLLHRPCRIAGCVFRLPVKVLGGACCLPDLAFHLGFDIAGGASKALFQLAAEIFGGASQSILVHRHVMSSCIESIVQQSSDDLVQAGGGYARSGRFTSSGALALPSGGGPARNGEKSANA